MVRPVRDLTGKKFGNLFVIRRVKNDKSNRAQFLTRCEVEGCGNEKVLLGDYLTHKTRPTTHCGCLTSKHNSDAQKGNTNSITHGLSKTPEYYAEQQAKRRIKKQNNNLAFNLSYAEPFAIPRLELDYCVYCGSTENLATDHIIPINKGGTQDPKNLIRACKSCNSAKRNLFFIDWYLKTDRVKRKLDDIITDMGFDSIVHLQNYQDSMCPEHIEKDPNVRFRKLVKADMKDINKLIDLL